MINKAFSDKIYNAGEFAKFVKSETDANVRYELIDGYIYMMGSPSVVHQEIVKFVSGAFDAYFADKACRTFFALLNVYLYVYLFDMKKIPFALAAKSRCANVFQPDVFVVCDKKKIKRNGVYGAPDLVAEVVSKSSSQPDYVLKFNSYMRFGVREYWIINYYAKQIVVYVNMPDDINMKVYGFDGAVRSGIFSGLSLDFNGAVFDADIS